jgi:hypothetical protein
MERNRSAMERNGRAMEHGRFDWERKHQAVERTQDDHAWVS